MAYFGIPSRHLLSPDYRAVRLSGFGDPEQEQFDRGVAALKAALELNPRAGYPRGSSARRKLEQAIDIIPDARAGAFAKTLETGTGPVARLFRRRLSDETRASIIGRLIGKQVRQVGVQLQNRLQDLGQQIRNLARKCRDVSDLCARTGDSSDECQAARSGLEQQGIRCR